MESIGARHLAAARHIAATLLIILALAGCATRCRQAEAENGDGAPAQTASPESEGPSDIEAAVDGDWQQIAIDSRRALEAYAVLQLELADREVMPGSIKEARQQVVSGYKVWLVCEYGENQTLAAVILLRSDGMTELLELDTDYPGTE